MDDWLKSQLKTHCAGAKPTQKGMTELKKVHIWYLFD